MPVLQGEHPSPEQLTAFGLGRLDDDASAAIEAHLVSCDGCRTVVETLPNDTLLSLLREREAGSAEAGAATTVPFQTSSSGLDQASPAIPPELGSHPRYRVLELLGAGGMGAVYKAEHRLMERHVALKIMNPILMKRPAMVERFRREVKAAARFSHPNIMTAYDADQAGDAHFLIMEFVEGVSLAQHVQKRGPLVVADACDYIRQAAIGLQFAAEHGMVHRDIKPHNLMLTPGGQVKILDFGLARLVREEALASEPPVPEVSATTDHGLGTTHHGPLTDVGTLMGTADYIAPEQANDPRQADIRADIYSLGCTLYYLLVGRAPFPEGSLLDKLAAHAERQPVPLGKLRGDLPAGLARVIDRMMAKDPAQRYQTPREVAEALQPFTAAGAARRRLVKQLALGAAAILVASLLAAAVIYIRTDNGELTIETSDDKVAVMVNDKGVKVRDEAAGREYSLKIGRHRLRPGEYKIDVQELPSGLQFETTSFTLNRGDKTLVKVTFDARKAPGYLKDEALRWFPAEATYFTATNMEQFSAIAKYQLYFFAESPSNRGRFWKFKEELGRMDRTSYAYIGDEKSPDVGSTFLRITGAINHNRLVEYFRKDWPGAVIEKLDSPGEPVTLIYDAQSDGVMSGAWALIGNSDVLNASTGKTTGKKHVDAMRKMLELRAGRGVSLPEAHAKELAELPANTGCLSIGKTPGFMKRLIPFLGSLPERMDSTLSGTTDVELRFRTTFSSEVNTQLFLATLKLIKQGFMELAKTIKDPDLSSATVRTMDSLRLESGPNRVAGSMQVSSVAWAAFTEAVQDIPPERLKDFIPGKDTRGVGPGQGAVDAKIVPGYLKDEALRWFPADATFYSAYNLQAFPALSQFHRLLFREELMAQGGPAPRRERLAKLVDLMGRIDRMSLAYSLKPLPPNRPRSFMRFTGSIARNRLLDFFRREWPGVQIEERQANGEQITLIYDTPGSVSLDMAVILVGNTDMIWAAYQGSGIEREVAEECLRLRAGQGISLPVAQAKALEEIPDNAQAFAIGETPEFLKKNLMVPSLLVQPRSFVMSFAGSSAVDVRFRGEFASDADAQRFMTILNLMKHGFASATAVLKNAGVAGAVAKALESLHIESEANRMSFRVHVPAEAWAALLDKLQDMPLRDYSGAFKPGENGTTRGHTKRPPGYLKDDGLRWFPADTTFFVAMNMEVFPEITRLPFLITADREGEASRRFFDVAGRIDRIACAWAENRQRPEQTRYFFRMTGKIARDRVIDHFRRHWKGSLREYRHRDGGDIVILHDRKEGAAIGLIGATDLIIASYDGPRQDGLPVLEESLDIRAGRRASLSAAQAAVLKDMPDDSWAISAGEPTEFFMKEYMFAFMRQIRSWVVWMRGENDVEMGFRGSFGTAAEAQSFSMVTSLMKRVFMNAPAVMKDAKLSAAVAQAFDTLKGENDGERFSGSVRIPSLAWQALLEKIANTPLKELIETPALNPGTQK